MTIRKITIITVCATLLVSGCAAPSLVKTVLGKSELTAKCNPARLEVRNNKVEATVTLDFPAGYMNSSSMIIVTPALVYDGGKRLGQPVLFQGTAVRSNYKVVPYSGAQHSIPVSFDYTEGIEQSFLELRLEMVSGQRKFSLPSIKVADGCNITATLADMDGILNYKADGYEHVRRYEAVTTINYDVNSSVVRDNVTTRNAIKQYRQQIADFNYDDSYTVAGTEIVAYASPEGGEELNSELSKDRAGTAQNALADYSKGRIADSIALRGLGQDWEGFKTAVQASEIQDKHLILRLLEMYEDPQEREEEIRNLSEVFEELKTDIFPILRRATYIVKADKHGLTDEQITAMAVKSLSSLSATELMRAATLEPDLKTKEFYYRTLLQRFHSLYAAFNMAVVSVERDKNNVALSYLNALDQADPDVQNAYGVIDLREGRPSEALEHFLAAEGNADAHLNAGAAYIALGDYPRALSCLEGSGTFNEALALTLCGELDKADSLVRADCPKGAYLKAVIAARKQDNSGASNYLKIAYSDEKLKKRALKDIEFMEIR